MLGLHAVTHMALGQRLQHGHERPQIVQLAHRRAEHLRQLVALLGQFALEERAQRRVGGEQVVVEQRRCCGAMGTTLAQLWRTRVMVSVFIRLSFRELWTGYKK
jgi:hypothetical protein